MSSGKKKITQGERTLKFVAEAYHKKERRGERNNAICYR